MITLEEIVSHENLVLAMNKVVDNKGVPGVDGMTCEELPEWFRKHAQELESDILDGTYRPLHIKRVYIDKENGEKRPLGIPTTRDRLVQQAIAQVLTEEYEPTFSRSSFGFRPGIGAHDAIKQVNDYLNEGFIAVIDLDLAKFFDTVSHSKLLRLLSERIKDGRVISLIGKILRAKIVENNTVTPSRMGLTQGAPCSPILANILLDLLDKELESRNHKFARYADDVIILCKSLRAAQRTYASIKKFIEKKLLLKINEDKTKVQSITPEIKFLGFAFLLQKPSKGKPARYRPFVHNKSKKRLVNTLRTKFLKKNRRQSIEGTRDATNRYLMGWAHYFAIGITKANMSKIESWIRRKIRAIYLKAWKKNRTKEENFKALGTNSKQRCHIVAHSSMGIWAKAHYANYIITKDVIHKQWGWMNISDIVKNKSWVILGY